MTIRQFEAATLYVQKAMVKFHGNFLLKKEIGSRVTNLYQVDGFYVEVINPFLPTALPLLRTISIDEIDDYLSQIDISFVHHLLL